MAIDPGLVNLNLDSVTHTYHGLTKAIVNTNELKTLCVKVVSYQGKTEELGITVCDLTAMLN